MNDAEFLKAMDRALFYGDARGGSVFLHPDDFTRYVKLLPKARLRMPGDDDSFEAWVYSPVERASTFGTSSRGLFTSEHTPLGMARIGWANQEKAPHIVYRPEGERMTVAEYAKRLDDLLSTHQPLWNPVYLHPTDLGRYVGAWGQQRLSNKPASNLRDKTLQGVLKFGKEERNLYSAPWVTLGTVVLGYTYSQTTHTIYMWTVPPVPGSRFDRDVDV